MTPEVKAIETSYRGYRFRSRLEARWAVFFDELKIGFQYEPEGFELEDGLRYLPDFFIPRIEFFAEVKPVELTKAERHKATLLSKYTKMPVLLLVGPPDFKTYDAIAAWDENWGPLVTDYLLDVDYHSRKYFDDEHRLYSSCAGSFCSSEEFSDKYHDAVIAARGARFDESGRW